ncbi:MAG: hypothetical protein Q7S20_02165 [Gemmatimonadaceae bacterium]|nr:hypothetical protein [Gemmatimonadaceae bacterium]
MSAAIAGSGSRTAGWVVGDAADALGAAATGAGTDAAGLAIGGVNAGRLLSGDRDEANSSVMNTPRTPTAASAPSPIWTPRGSADWAGPAGERNEKKLFGANACSGGMRCFFS